MASLPYSHVGNRPQDTKQTDIVRMLFAGRANDMSLVMQSDPSLSKCNKVLTVKSAQLPPCLRAQVPSDLGAQRHGADR